MSVTETFNVVSRIQEKHELQEINDRFSQYIQGMRDVREAANEQNLQAFVESISVLENGLQNLKILYEKELDNVRRDSSDLNRTKNEYLLEIDKCRRLNAELENKLAKTSDKHRRTTDEVNQLHRSLVLKEQEVRDQQVAMKRPIDELEELHKDYEDVLRENQDLRRKYEAEQFARREAEDQLTQLRQKHDFHLEISTQEKNDLSDRLNRASNTIVNLETKIRELNEALDTARGEMLTRVHEAAESELRRYQAESEQMFNRSITALKIQMDEDRMKLEDLTTKNIGLTGDIGELLQKIRSLESQVAGLDHQKQVVESIIGNERQKAREHVQFLEKKLRDIQDVLVEKMRELNTSRDAQIPMKAEIEALKSMLEQEEKRIYQPLDTGAVAARPAYGIFPGESKNSGRLPPAVGTNSQLTAQPVGPITRAKSAPVFGQRTRLVPTQLGQGKDYFDAMFYDLKNETQRLLNNSTRTPTPPKVPTPDRPSTSPVAPPTSSPSPIPDRSTSSMSHDYAAATSSATGDIKILEVHPDGKYVRIINTNPTNDEEIGGYSIQQNVEGHPVAGFVFPERLTLPSRKLVTVWSGNSDPALHDPPNDFVFTEHNRWGTGPYCTTILCKQSGQAVAWATSARTLNKDAFDSFSQSRSAQETPGPIPPRDQQDIQNILQVFPNGSTDQLTNVQTEPPTEDMKEPELTKASLPPNGCKVDPVFIRRVKEEAPGLNAQKHPHGSPPSSPAHPATGAPRPKTHGNDNSSVNRQSRAQSVRPDPIPGAPYAGASAQRMGSSMLRRYTPPKIRGGSGSVANKALGDPVPETSRPPSSFEPPRSRFNAGLEQIKSQHHQDFLPPMPRPPMFSTW